ncbi:MULTISPECIES: hypothetical protein [unclassified Duganella]|uniref:hypothetical protein n=1 Tax=unclassified Duganella TaxID=2636909 RepID=UPI000E343A84|nr:MULTISPECIES: hypothetical protein [unclassified Duganella]RFP15937.1 hypothetical protein D0T23_08520 [Duganella sp. BJB475]RFP32898.1 hypothetical protein D0T21_12110 [Duganella sp. BJB476]
MIKSIFLSLALAGTSMMAGAAEVDVANGIQMAQVDYDAYHALLVERCKVLAPESVEALTAAMAQWKQQNAAALVMLRQLYKAQLIQQKRAQKPDTTDADMDAYVAAVLDYLNGNLKERVAGVPADKARASCEGEYANDLLNRPAMDFNVLLKRMTLGR